ncbi:MAG: AmmeMemoRadiSam system protein A [archaeon]
MIGEYDDKDGQMLIKLARDTIQAGFTNEEVKMPPEARFKQARGVFVTLHKNGQLRGCIGLPYPSNAVADAVVEAAKSAAFEDPRFPPVSEGELKDIEIEISVLTPPVKCVAKDVNVGRDGLMCEFHGYTGLLLPQVATEHGMDRVQFIEALCQKASLPKDAWQKEGFKLQKFQAQIFKEENEDN